MDSKFSEKSTNQTQALFFQVIFDTYNRGLMGF